MSALGSILNVGTTTDGRTQMMRVGPSTDGERYPCGVLPSRPIGGIAVLLCRWYRTWRAHLPTSSAGLVLALVAAGALSSGCIAPLALQPRVGGEALELRLDPKECASLRKEVRRASAVELGGKALVAGLGAGSALHGALGESRGAQVGLAVGTLLAGGVVAVADYLSDSAAQEHESGCR